MLGNMTSKVIGGGQPRVTYVMKDINNLKMLYSLENVLLEITLYIYETA